MSINHRVNHFNSNLSYNAISIYHILIKHYQLRITQLLLKQGHGYRHLSYHLLFLHSLINIPKHHYQPLSLEKLKTINRCVNRRNQHLLPGEVWLITVLLFLKERPFLRVGKIIDPVTIERYLEVLRDTGNHGFLLGKGQNDVTLKVLRQLQVRNVQPLGPYDAIALLYQA